MTLAFSLLVLKDLQRNLLSGGLTQRKPTQTLDNAMKTTERDAIAAGCTAAFSAARVVNSRIQNIFNGLLLVRLMEKFRH